MASLKTVQVKTASYKGAKVECEARGLKVIIDQPKAAGGEDSGPTPLEAFLMSLGACICSIARIVARQKGIDLRSVEAAVEGDLDTDYLLGKTRQGRAGFSAVRVVAKIDADLPDQDKRTFLAEVDRRCPISDLTHSGCPIKVDLA